LLFCKGNLIHIVTLKCDLPDEGVVCVHLTPEHVDVIPTERHERIVDVQIPIGQLDALYEEAVRTLKPFVCRFLVQVKHGRNRLVASRSIAALGVNTCQKL